MMVKWSENEPEKVLILKLFYNLKVEVPTYSLYLFLYFFYVYFIYQKKL